MGSLFQDLRFAARTLGRAPVFTLVAIVSLSLGIGAHTSVYALVQALFFAPPIGAADPDGLVRICKLSKGRPDEDALLYSDYVYYRDHNTVFSGLASHTNSGAGLIDTERGDELDSYVVSANYFAVLGLTPLGRFFTPDEDAVPGRDPVVVLSHSFWQRRFDGDPHCLGRTVKLRGRHGSAASPPPSAGGSTASTYRWRTSGRSSSGSWTWTASGCRSKTPISPPPLDGTG